MRLLEKNIFLILFTFIFIFNCDGQKNENTGPLNLSAAQGIDEWKTTIIYDNYEYDPLMKSAWGFSCLFETRHIRILFDTGGDSSVLIHNMEKLKLDISKIDAIVLSHIHGDHVGGLFAVLNRNPNLTVFVPATFPTDFKKQIQEKANKLVELDSATQLFPNIYSTGPLGRRISEQSLVVNLKQGLFVITGCAHPGIDNIIQFAADTFNRNPHIVIGGFHLLRTNNSDIEEIIEIFDKLKTARVGPSHCTGDEARKLFREHYKSSFIDLGVGRILDQHILENN